MTYTSYDNLQFAEDGHYLAIWCNQTKQC
jgi:hypothetical protein